MKVESTVTHPPVAPRPFALRLDTGLRLRVHEAARRLGTTRSGVVRLALLNQLPEIEAKRLTLKEGV